MVQGWGHPAHRSHPPAQPWPAPTAWAHGKKTLVLKATNAQVMGWFAQAQFNPRCPVGADKLRPGTSQLPQDQARCHHVDPPGTTHGSSPTDPP